ncbi:hypothetical protein ACFXHA_43610 [Nocardia sp. NPDC059240]|uniref:hypothetical protein n=1 Tax=Nocardia sp. NPDC059240 TaxID=3346786 RepID=UPI003676FB25
MTSAEPAPSSLEEEWLVTLTGPVGNTYVCLTCTAAEAAAYVRLVRAVAATITDDTQPGIRVQPLDDAGPTERARLIYADRARLRAALNYRRTA